MAEVGKKKPKHDQTAFKRKPKVVRTVVITLSILIALFVARFIWERTYKERYPKEYGFAYPLVDSDIMEPDTFIDLGSVAESENRFNDAIVIYKIGLQYFPKNSDLWEDLSRVYRIKGDRKNAAEAMAKVAARRPDDAKTHYELALLYYQINAFDKALPPIERAVALADKNRKYLTTQAHIAGLNKDYELAYDSFSKLFEKKSHDADLQFALAKTKAWAKEHPPKNHPKMLLEEADRFFEQGNIYAGNESLGHYVVLFGQTQAIQLLLAEEIYHSILKDNPQDSETWYRLAQLYYQFNQPIDALDAIKKALDKEESNLQYLKLYVLISTQLDNRQARMDAYEKILSIIPDNEPIKRQLIIMRTTNEVNLTEQQIQSHPLLLQATFEIHDEQYLEALKSLEDYSKEVIKDPLYEKLLAYLSTKIDLCTVRSFCCSSEVAEMAQAFTEGSIVQQDDLYTLENAANILGKNLIRREPCHIPYLYQYADILRLNEDIVPPDFVATQRTYCQILDINPCDGNALRHLARVTALQQEVDTASSLYTQYVRRFPADEEVLIEYADILEDQGNIYASLKVLERYRECYGADQLYWEKKAHILNSGDYGAHALAISHYLMEKNPDSYNARLNYAKAVATLNATRESLESLEAITEMQPGHPEVEGVEMRAIPPLMSYARGYGEFYQETTSLTDWTEGVEFGLTLCPGFQIDAGVEAFQTSATSTFVAVLGLGTLRQLNGEAWASAEYYWAGINAIVHPKFIVNVGGGWMTANTNYDTPAYRANFFMPVCDNLELNFYSDYGFFLISPRTLSIPVKQWKNQFTFDWFPSPACELITLLESNINTDGNKGYQATVYPRKTVLFLEHWKVDVGLMGDWFGYNREFVNGYYSPYLYQAYAAECLLDYRFDYNNVLKIEGSLGIQRDTFGSRFGFLGDLQVQGLFNITLNWYANFFGEYYYIDTSNGYFSFLNFGGGVTYRF